MRIKILEMQLGCLVVVLHVPGTVMISEGTDGLSRGFSRQGLQHYTGHELLSNICRAAPLLPVVLTWAQHVLQYVFPLLHHGYLSMTIVISLVLDWWETTGFGVSPR